MIFLQLISFSNLIKRSGDKLKFELTEKMFLIFNSTSLQLALDCVEKFPPINFSWVVLNVKKFLEKFKCCHRNHSQIHFSIGFYFIEYDF